MSAPWPPPPDLDSIRELVRAADPEGHLAEGAAADEYEPEEEAVYAAIAGWPTEDLTAAKLLPVLTQAWEASFGEDAPAHEARGAALAALAAQIARFFGPEAQPQVRSQPGR